MDAPAAADDVAVDDMLCLALHTAARTITARYRPLLAELGLTYPQYLVMALLWQDGAQSVGVLADRLALDPSTLSPLLKRLEAARLVTRRRDPQDERSVVVAATARGTRLRARAADVPGQICDASGLSLEHQAALVRRLRRLTAALSAR